MKTKNTTWARLAITVFTVTIFTAQVCKAQLAFFTSRSAWEAALASLPTVNANLSSVTSNVDLCPEGTSATFGTHKFTSVSCFNSFAVQIVAPSPSSFAFPNQPHVYYVGSTTGNPRVKVQTPTTSAIGFDWQTQAPSSNGAHNSLWLQIYSASGGTSQLLNQTTTSGFIGVISYCNDITSYDMYSALTNFQQFAMTNFSYSTGVFPSIPPSITSVTALQNPIIPPATTTTLTANGVTGTGATVTWWSQSGGNGTNYGTGTTLPNAGVGTYYARVTVPCGPAVVERSIIVTANTCDNWYLDADGDGYYSGSPVFACSSPGAGYTKTFIGDGDCDDNNNLVNRSMNELPGDGIDNNCNGIQNENNGLSFDGTDDYLGTTFFARPANYTIEAWVKTTAVGPRTIAGWGSGSLQNSVLTIDGGYLRYYQYNGGYQITDGYFGFTINDNKWHHVACTFTSATGTHTIRLYIDGKLVRQGTGTNPAAAELNNFQVGAVKNWNWPFQGSLDEVKIWNTARTDAQIVAGMNASFCGNETGLVRYYPFNHGIAGANNNNILGVQDVSNSHSNGTFNNFSLTGTSGNFVTGAPLVVSAPLNQILSASGVACTASYSIPDAIPGTCTNGTWSYTLSGATTGSLAGIADGTNAAPVSFNNGVTTVTLSGIDAYGGTALPVSFTVTVNAPDINVQGGIPLLPIPDGNTAISVTNNTDFGSVGIDFSMAKSYTIQNLGTANLNISAITTGGTNQSEFVVSGITLPATIAANGSATFTVTFAPTGIGMRSATILINNNDCDEAPYDFAIGGTGFCVTQPTTRLYVDANAAPGGTGASWACALQQLSTAITMANTTPAFTSIWVADGIYKPTTGSSRTAVMAITRANLTILGGFAGGEANAGDANPAVNFSIISGDIGIANDVSDNSYRLMNIGGSPVTPNALVVDGFVFEKGNANGSGDNAVGAAILSNAFPAATPVQIKRCTFRYNNAGANGGAVYLTNSNLAFEGCRFEGNTAASGGGGVYTFQASPSFSNTVFAANNAPNGGGYYGNYGYPTFSKTVFTGNSATYGGGVYQSRTNADYMNCVFNANTSFQGGAIYEQNASFSHIVNSTFFKNSGTSYGGTIVLTGSNSSTKTENSIFWKNTHNGSAVSPWADFVNYTAGANVYANNILQLNTAVPADNGATIRNNTRGTDPLFVNEASVLGGDGIWGTADDGLKPTNGSPAVNSGDNALSPLGTDITNSPRIECSTVDKGAYETQNCIAASFALQETGAVTIASTIGIVENPFRNDLQIRYSGTEKAAVTVYGAEGKKVWSKTNIAEGITHADAGNWSRGIYQVLIITASGKMMNFKVVKL